MLRGSGKKIVMTEEDYGLYLPIRIIGATFESNDKIKLYIKQKKDGESLIEKEFLNIADNTINFVLTEQESALLPKGTYIYVLDWYRDEEFLCNIVPSGVLEVEDKY